MRNIWLKTRKSLLQNEVKNMRSNGEADGAFKHKLIFFIRIALVIAILVFIFYPSKVVFGVHRDEYLKDSVLPWPPISNCYPACRGLLTGEQCVRVGRSTFDKCTATCWGIDASNCNHTAKTEFLIKLINLYSFGSKSRSSLH